MSVIPVIRIHNYFFLKISLLNSSFKFYTQTSLLCNQINEKIYVLFSLVILELVCFLFVKQGQSVRSLSIIFCVCA